MVRSCKLAQVTFEYCDPDHDPLSQKYLRSCIYTNICKSHELDQTNCKAPAYEHCEDVDSMQYMFWFNAVVNFFSYAEPVMMALLVLLRMEITNDTCPDPPKDGEAEYPHQAWEPWNPPIFYHKDEEETTHGSAAERAPLRPPFTGKETKHDDTLDAHHNVCNID